MRQQDFMINVIPNKSRTYMLPYLTAQFDFDFNNRLLNTYLSFDGDEDDESFCLLYDWHAGADFIKFEGLLMKHVLFLYHKDYDGKTLYKFRLSRHMSIGREQFINGLYTEFSEDHKKSIEKYLNDQNASNKHRIMEILDPDGELSSTPPDMEKETFSNHIKEIKITRDTFI